MPPTGANKARAWRLAAGHLAAIAEEKQREPMREEDHRVWSHVLNAVVPSLYRRATIIENRRKGQ